jgi:hypothetical protein
MGLRKCERCVGPGPCLWDPADGRYLCQGCHSCKDDPLFSRLPVQETKSALRTVTLHADEWDTIVRHISDPAVALLLSMQLGGFRP